MQTKTGGSSPLFRDKIAALLHAEPRPVKYDNDVIWAGNMGIQCGGELCISTMNRLFLDTDAGTTIKATVQVEFHAPGITDAPGFCDADLDARLWLDINNRGFVDETGFHFPALPEYKPMRILRGPDGNPIIRDEYIVYTSDEIEIYNTGVFNYTTSFSADDSPCDAPDKKWVTVNELAHNRDGLIVVSPDIVRQCPSITEVCVRKFGAKNMGGKFQSGKITYLIADLENITTEIIYLLPFFLSGTFDSTTGMDVRKGELGSIYAVKDFFKIDPDIVTPALDADIESLSAAGLFRESDFPEILDGRRRAALGTLDNLGKQSAAELVKLLGGDTLTQLIGRAELRLLCRKAHELGKRVIFDLVVMQTSRDSSLINDHLDWYCLDENNSPQTHHIAWLDYSDVALLKLSFNKPLQNYLSSIAPYWIEKCDFDGVRIDASQTVDRPFLKQVKNRINAARPDAIVIGETLCPLEQAVDVPTDMIYTLLVDHHIHTQHANVFINIFEETQDAFAHGTVGMAYFENHDSVRATFEWHRRFCDQIRADASLRHYWSAQAASIFSAEQLNSEWDLAYFPALLKNIMSSLIDCSAGTRDSVMFAYTLEAGSDYGEEQRTDFENATVLYQENRTKSPHTMLYDSYKKLAELKRDYPLLHQGRVFYLRNGCPGTDPEDKLLVYIKHNGSKSLIVAANLDLANAHQGRYKLPFLNLDPKHTYKMNVIFNSFALFKSPQRFPTPMEMIGKALIENGLPLLVSPLCATVIEIG